MKGHRKLPEFRPERVTIMVETTYFACADSEHRHAKQEAAKKCMEKSYLRSLVHRWTREDMRRVYSMFWHDGLSYAEIGRLIHRSGSRVRQLLSKAERTEFLLSDEYRMAFERDGYPGAPHKAAKEAWYARLESIRKEAIASRRNT